MFQAAPIYFDNYALKIITTGEQEQMSLIDEIMMFEIARAAVINPSAVRYSSEFRKLCEQNKCGYYGKNWMCPPHVGSYGELKERAGRYKKGLMFQTIHQIFHSGDRKKYRDAFKAHNEALRKIVKHLQEMYGIEDMLTLGGGPCTYCEKCSALDEEPCRYPDHAVASLESYGIDVGALVTLYGMPYKFEKDIVTLVGAVFYNLP